MTKNKLHEMLKKLGLGVGLSILTACASTPKIQTILTKPDPCALPPWPDTPEVYLVQNCPDGLVCITYADQLTLWHHEADFTRMKEYLDTCPWVKFVPADDPTVIQGPTPRADSHVSP